MVENSVREKCLQRHGCDRPLPTAAAPHTPLAGGPTMDFSLRYQLEKAFSAPSRAAGKE